MLTSSPIRLGTLPLCGTPVFHQRWFDRFFDGSDGIDPEPLLSTWKTSPFLISLVFKRWRQRSPLLHQSPLQILNVRDSIPLDHIIDII